MELGVTHVVQFGLIVEDKGPQSVIPRSEIELIELGCGRIL